MLRTEPLERRNLLALTVSLTGNDLLIEADAADEIYLVENGTDLEIYEAGNNLVSAVNAADVFTITINASGAFDNLINLGSLTPGVTSNLVSVTVDGGDGNDNLLTDSAGEVTMSGALSIVNVESVDLNNPINVGSADITAAAIALNTPTVTASSSLLFDGPTTLLADVQLTAGDLTFQSTIDGTFQLTADVSGTTAFNGSVGSTTPLASLTVIGNGQINFNAALFRTDGDQSFTGSSILDTNATFNAANVTFIGSLNGNADVALSVSGVSSFEGSVGDVTPLTNFTADGDVSFNGPTLAVSNELIFNNNLTLQGSATFSAVEIDFNGGAASVSGAGQSLTLQPTANTAAINVGGAGMTADLDLTQAELDAFSPGFASITIGAADGEHAITLDAPTFNNPLTIRSPNGGSITLDGNLTMQSSTAAVVLSGSGATTTLNGDIITAGAPITIEDAIILGTPATILLDTTDGGAVPAGANITLTSPGTVNDDVADSSSLLLQAGTGGSITLDGAVGDIDAITSLTATGAAIALNGGTLTTTQDQVYNGPTTLGANTVVNGNNLLFTSTLDGAFDLASSVTGETTFEGDVGGTTPLANLSTVGAVNFNAAAYATSGDQTYGGIATLNASGTFNAANLSFNATLDGANDLTANVTNEIAFNGDVGATTPLTSITTNGGETVRFNLATVDTVNDQSYGGAVVIDADVALTSASGNIAFAGGFNYTNAFNLGATAAGSISIGGDSTTGTGTLNFNSNGFSLDASLTGDGVFAVQGAGVTASDIAINGALTQPLVTFNTPDNISINGAVTSSERINVIAGEDGSGNVTVTAAGSLNQTTVNANQPSVLILTGAMSGNISLAGDVSVVGDTLQMIAPAGNITQTTGNVVAVNVNLVAASSITLTSGNNDIQGSVTANAPDAISLVDANGLLLHDVRVSNGNLSAIANLGAITSSATAVVDVAGNAFFSAPTISLLTDTINFGSLRVVGGQVTIVEDSDTVFSGPSAVGPGGLSLTAPGISQAVGATMNVQGTTLLNAGPNNITLANVGNDFVGAVSIPTAANVTLRDANGLPFGAVNITGNLSTISGGDVTSTGALVIAGTSSFNAGTANVVLTNAGNNFVGAVSIPAANNVTLRDLNGLNLGTSNIANNLTATAGAAITDTGNLTVTGTATLTAGGAITLGESGELVRIGNLTFQGTAIDIRVSQSLTLVGASSGSSLLLNVLDGPAVDDADLTVAPGASVVSTAAPQINVGDSFNLAATSSIASPGNTFTINAANDTADGLGGTVRLFGTLTGSQVNINTGNKADAVLVGRIDSPTTVRTNDGNDLIVVSSDASGTAAAGEAVLRDKTINNGGNLNAINARLTLVPGFNTAMGNVAETDQILISDATGSPNLQATVTIDYTAKKAEIGGFAGPSNNRVIEIDFLGDNDLTIATPIVDRINLAVRGSNAFVPLVNDSGRDFLSLYVLGNLGLPAAANNPVSFLYDGNAPTAAQVPVPPNDATGGSLPRGDGFRIIGNDGLADIVTFHNFDLNAVVNTNPFQLTNIETIQFFGRGGDDTAIIDPAVVYSGSLLVGGDGTDTLTGGNGTAGDVLFGAAGVGNVLSGGPAANDPGRARDTAISGFDVIFDSSLDPATPYTAVQVIASGDSVANSGTAVGDRLQLDIIMWLTGTVLPSALGGNTIDLSLLRASSRPFTAPILPSFAPPANFTQYGTALVITGTPDDDTVQVTFNSNGGLTIVVNSESHTYTSGQVSAVYFYGGGNDQVEVTGTSGFESVAMWPRQMLVMAGGVNFWSFNARDNKFNASVGDLVQLIDGASVSTTTLGPTQTQVVGPDYTMTTAGNSLAFVFGQPDDNPAVFTHVEGQLDVFYGLPEYSLMYGANYYRQVIGFSQVVAYGNAADNDVAVFIDSIFDDHFNATPILSTQVGPGYQLDAHNFAQAYSLSVNGGNDTADFYDSEGDDNFYSVPSISALIGPGFLLETVNYKTVTVHAENGGNDNAYLYDSFGVDKLTASGSSATLEYMANTVVITGFDRVFAITSQINVDELDEDSIDYVLTTIGIWKNV